MRAIGSGTWKGGSVCVGPGSGAQMCVLPSVLLVLAVLQPARGALLLGTAASGPSRHPMPVELLSAPPYACVVGAYMAKGRDAVSLHGHVRAVVPTGVVAYERVVLERRNQCHASLAEGRVPAIACHERTSSL